MNDAIQVQIEAGVATVTLCRPEASNAVNATLRAGLTQALTALNRSPEVAAVLITGAGRSFCAGQDLHEATTLDAVSVVGWQEHQRAMFQAIRDLDKPCVAALNGAAVGAGFQIALCADLRVAHAGVRLGQPEVRAGLASIVGSYLMSLHLGLSKNTELSLGGKLIDATQAHALGLVHELAAPEQVLPRARHLALELVALPATAFRLTKQRFRETTQAGFDAACAAGARLQAECYATGEPQRVLAARLAGRERP